MDPEVAILSICIQEVKFQSGFMNIVIDVKEKVVLSCLIPFLRNSKAKALRQFLI